MVSKTNEKALGTSIEQALTGVCLEELGNGLNVFAEPQEIVSEPVKHYRGGNSFFCGTAKDFNAQYAIKETRFWHFLESRQKDELDKLNCTAPSANTLSAIVMSGHPNKKK